MKVELGAGRTTSDISVLAWVPIINNYTATVTYKIDVADGERAFIRIRATNNGMYILQDGFMLISFISTCVINNMIFTMQVSTRHCSNY